MSWYTKSDRYASDRPNQDVEAVTRYYKNRGYLEFKVDSTQVALTPDKTGINITMNVTEGPRYVVSGVSLAGDYLQRENEFQSLVKIKPGEAYKIDDVDATVQAMENHFGNYGYAFAKVNAVPQVDRERQQVALMLEAVPSDRAYVRNINISGNARTRDEVIRRELRQYESSWYNSDKIQTSRARVDRLGYFTDVQVSTQPVAGTSDQADLNVNVKEAHTGSLQLGLGYSTSDSVSFLVGVSQDNIFGSGQSLAFEASNSEYNRTFSLRQGSNVLGRGQDAQFRLPDTGVSRRHAEIRWDGQVAMLTDLNSTNGTTVNDLQVSSWELANGDRIRLGHSDITVRFQ